MSIKIYQSYSYSELIKKFSDCFCSTGKSVFRSDPIFYQVRGVRSKLPVEMAKTNGIFAGVEFIPLSKLEDTIIMKTGIENYIPVSDINLKYSIYSCLNNKEFVDQFPAVASYYQGNTIKRMQLAIKIAGMFSTYVEYRRDYLINWLADKFVTTDSHEKWQAQLWKILYKENSTLSYWFEQKISFIEKLQSDDIKAIIKKEFPIINFFGISTLSNNEIQIIKALSEITEVVLFAFSPSKNLADNSNEFVQFLAKNASELSEKLSINFNNSDFEFLHTGENKTESLLSKLRKDIIQGSAQPSFNANEPDLSIQINSNYTAVRELEALYSFLLKIVNEDKSILPKDIVVLIPDLEKYAPFIKSVFDSNATDYNFRYSISREVYSGNDSPAGLLEILMSMNVESFTSEKIAQLLEYKHIADVFAINDSAKIREWLKEANIRCGIKGAGSAENETYIVSFKYGLQRLIYGFALGENQKYKSDGISFEAPAGQEIYPVGMFDGSSDLILLTRLKNFIDLLSDMIIKRESDKTLADWVQYVRTDVILPLLTKSDAQNSTENEDDEDETRQIGFLERKLADFMRGIPESIELLSYDCFNTLFSGYISSHISQTRNAAGGITFTDYSAFQGMEFKVVALLGANYNSLPRKQELPSFNLMNMKVKGDPDIKEQDKYVFLQSILSATDYLYLSYLGRSAKDNSVMPPSIFIQQVIDYIGIKDKEPKPDSRIWIQHPLHSFSVKYNNPIYPRLVSFNVADSKKTYQIAIKTESDESQNDNGIKEIQIRKLVDFFKDPFKFYFINKLGLYPDEDDLNLPQIEEFEIGSKLDEHFVKSFFIENVTEEERQEFILSSKHTGLLPFAKQGDDEIDRIISDEDFKRIKENYLSLKTEAEDVIKKLQVKLPDGRELHGDLRLNGNKYIKYCFSKWPSTPKYLLDIWINHLFAIASGAEINSYIVVRVNEYNQTNTIISFNSQDIQKPDAIDYLQKMVEIYVESRTQIFPFSYLFALPDNALSIDKVLEISPSEYLQKAIEIKLVSKSEIVECSESNSSVIYPREFVKSLKSN